MTNFILFLKTTLHFEGINMHEIDTKIMQTQNYKLSITQSIVPCGVTLTQHITQ